MTDQNRTDAFNKAVVLWLRPRTGKSHPNHPEYGEALVAFEQAKAPANHGPARRTLDAALRQADQNYHTELAELGRAHGVSVR